MKSKTWVALVGLELGWADNFQFVFILNKKIWISFIIFECFWHVLSLICHHIIIRCRLCMPKILRQSNRIVSCDGVSRDLTILFTRKYLQIGSVLINLNAIKPTGYHCKEFPWWTAIQSNLEPGRRPNLTILGCIRIYKYSLNELRDMKPLDTEFVTTC